LPEVNSAQSVFSGWRESQEKGERGVPKLQDWLHTSERIQGSMLMPHLRGFALPLLDDGYADATVS